MITFFNFTFIGFCGACLLCVVGVPMFVGCSTEVYLYDGRFGGSSGPDIDEFSVFDENGTMIVLSKDEILKVKTLMGKRWLDDESSSFSNNFFTKRREIRPFKCVCVFPDAEVNFFGWFVSDGDEDFFVMNIPEYHTHRSGDVNMRFSIDQAFSVQRSIEFRKLKEGPKD